LLGISARQAEKIAASLGPVVLRIWREVGRDRGADIPPEGKSRVTRTRSSAKINTPTTHTR
jgi:hypothetical protein